MKRTVKGISITGKFLALLVVVLILAAADYRYFVAKSGKVALYDDINKRLGTVRVSITKLEYLMDMFMAAQRFEVTTVNLIEDDVNSLDRAFNDIFSDPRYNRIRTSRGQMAEGLDSMAEDWRLIKDEISRLNTSSDQDEVMLIHNAVDLHTILITEKAERLQGVIGALRSGVYSELRYLLFATLAGAVVILLALFLAVYRILVIPSMRIAEAAARVSSGWPDVRFTGPGRGLAGTVTTELNGMLDSIHEAYGARERERDDLAARLSDKAPHMDALKAVAAIAGRSISIGDICSGVVNEVLHAGKADAACLFVLEGNSMSLKAAGGFDDNFLREFKVMDRLPPDFCAEGGRTERPSRVLYAPYAFPCGRLGDFLSRSGFAVVVCAPLEYDGRTTGYLLSAFRERGEAPEENRSFFEAVAHVAGVLGGYIGLIQGTHDTRKFLERIIMQMPFGVAVFDREGRPLVSNNLIRKYLGAPRDFDFTARYRLTEDTVFSEEGLLLSMEKAFEGYSTDFIVNYNPAHLEKLDFSGPTRRLKVKCYPLYGAGGDINEIVLICDDLTQLESAAAGAGERVS
ncbi:MAG: hypothetical protein ACE5EI_01995 [Thermodesulfobacteriota bacterium]